MPTNKIIYIDIDGIICTDECGNYEEAKPLYNNIKLINELYKENWIVLWTARGTTTKKDWREFTEIQLKKWGVKYDDLRFGKPYYDILIDDKSRKDLNEL